MRILAIKYQPNDVLLKKDKEKTAHFVRCYEKYVALGVGKEQASLQLPPCDIKESKSGNAGCCKEFSVLVWRNAKGISRDPMQLQAKIG